MGAVDGRGGGGILGSCLKGAFIDRRGWRFDTSFWYIVIVDSVPSKRSERYAIKLVSGGAEA